MEIETAYKQKMAAQLKEWSAQIDLLEAKIANAGADAEVKRAKELQELRVKIKSAAQKINEIETSTGEAWEQVKATSDKIWEELKIGVAAAHSKFK